MTSEDLPRLPDAGYYCGGRKHQGDPPGAPCRLRAGWGTSHAGVGRCKLHGGTLNGSQAAGARDLLVRDANRALKSYGFTPVSDPLTALADLAGECTAMKTYFGDRVSSLREQELTSQTVRGQEQVHALLSAYERALDRCGKVLTDMARLGLDERLVRVNEVVASSLGRSLDHVLGNPALGITADQRAGILRLLAAELEQ